jgi:uncharacterized membrane protein (DUF373 family)
VVPQIQNVNMQALFDRALKYIINVLIVYIILILVLGLCKILFFSTLMISGGQFLEFNLSIVVTDILTFLVIIELFKSFIEYFKAKRFRLHTMLDPAIIFIVRELIVKLYSHEKMTGEILFGFAGLVLCIGAVRTLAVVYSPDDEKN